MNRNPPGNKTQPIPDLMMVYTDPLFRIRWMNETLSAFAGESLQDASLHEIVAEIPARQLTATPEIWKGVVNLKVAKNVSIGLESEFNPLYDHRKELCGWLGLMQAKDEVSSLILRAGMFHQSISDPSQEQGIRAMIRNLEALLPQTEYCLVLRPVSRIWIVDDDSVITYITRRLIHSVEPEMEVREFLSAKMALEKLRIDGSLPDLILLDINMPGLTGWSFLDQLNQLRHQVGVYMYSTSIDPEDVKRARAYEVVRDFLPKPLDTKTIRRLLQLPDQHQKVS
jgi:CheY-like chemotaxis protein